MGRKVFLIKLVLVALVIVSIFIYLITHIYNLQIEKHEELYGKAKQKYTTVKSIKGSRGEIYDKNGYFLVSNVPSVDVRADPQLLGSEWQIKDTALLFSEKLQLPYDEIFTRLNRKYTSEGRQIREVVIKNQISLDDANFLKDEVKKRKIKGIFFFDSSKRVYPKDELLSNVLGFVNVDGLDVVPVSGLEKAYNSILSPGQANITVYERARDGIPLAYGNQRSEDKRQGDNIYLTISEPIQSILEEELNNIVEKWNPKAAYAVMVDPRTGSIIAMAQRPTFNPNDRSSMIKGDWQNRIVTHGFEPGSIMKPLVIAKALDMGIVTPDTIYDCENGRWLYGGKILRDTHPYGKISVAEIIQKSSNIGTAKISIDMGQKNLYELFVSYGFGQRSGLPFNPEARGILRKYERWDTLSISRFPIGQGILTTPLQLVSAYTALANGGERMKLRIVDKIENTDNGMIYNFPVKKGERIFSESSARKMVEMMNMVTEDGGTAVRARIPGYRVAGKTGTAQKWVDGKYSNTLHIASFIGFVPSEDPAFILLVSIDEPKGSSYGGVVAAPAFVQIAEKTLKYLGIRPKIP